MQNFISQPINFDVYTGFDERQPINQTLVAVHADDYFSIGNDYYRAGLPGTLPTVYLRAELVERLQKALHLLPAGYKFHIFDGYRSFTTQTAAFQFFLEKIKAEEGLSEEAAFAKTRQFFSFPSREHVDVIPHLSGGAVDLCLALKQKPLDMGTAFDTTSELSYTAAFEGPWSAQSQMSEERWSTVRRNRRLLFYAMAAVGFTNYQNEWWHYDFGDCMWASRQGADLIFGSAEKLLEDLLAR